MPTDSPHLMVDAASTDVREADYAGRDVVVLVGLVGSQRGVRLLVPCRLVADETSPLYFGTVGQMERSRRKMAANGYVAIVLVGPREAVASAARENYGRRVRIEYLEAPDADR